MATLTEIARKLKDAFEGYSVPEMQETLRAFKETNNIREAESIRIGEMNYIVINDVYKREEFKELPENVSPLFYNSINNKYAIIDAKTSSTLIDEVFSRVIYIKRTCGTESDSDKREIWSNLTERFGPELTPGEVLVESVEPDKMEYADFYQLHLILDSGVSAVNGTYDYMMKGGKIKEIPAHVMRGVRRTGEISTMQDRDPLEENKDKIQTAVFEKYSNSDADIESVTVKSIFQICIPTMQIHPQVRDAFFGRVGRYNTLYLAGKNNQFSLLNKSIHTCNLCGKDLKRINDGTSNLLHINIDAVLREGGKPNPDIYALGCEECLEQCPDCGSWHFKYENFLGTRYYDDLGKDYALAPGRSFIRRLNTVSGNYCSCREYIDWVYDEHTGAEGEHDIISIEKISFVNYANEQIASYKEYEKFLKKALKKVSEPKDMNDVAARHQFFKAQQDAAKQAFAEFRRNLAEQYDATATGKLDVKDIIVTSIDKCRRCIVCDGVYYWGVEGGDYNYRCPVCEEMVSENRHMVTRNDGIIFMRRRTKRGYVIDKYVVTKLGNLKRLSTNIEKAGQSEEEQSEQDETLADEVRS